MVLRSLLGLLSGSKPTASESGEFELRLDDALIGDSNDLPVKEIKGRGAFPVSQPVSNAAFITSLFDVTDEEPKPVSLPSIAFRNQALPPFLFNRKLEMRHLLSISRTGLQSVSLYRRFYTRQEADNAELKLLLG